jgi:hypothetical protein
VGIELEQAKSTQINQNTLDNFLANLNESD